MKDADIYKFVRKSGSDSTDDVITSSEKAHPHTTNTTQRTKVRRRPGAGVLNLGVETP